MNIAKKFAEGERPPKEVVELAGFKAVAPKIYSKVHIRVPRASGFSVFRERKRVEGMKEGVKPPRRLFPDYVLSVIRGKESYVYLFGRFVRVGESFKGVKVKGIDDEFVYLEFMGKVYRIRY